ncbi:MAG: hypothetical protein VX938_13520, partial [Myxococcota bacterium]|nr:hypothetical protein [Myxococcota bacterium]
MKTTTLTRSSLPLAALALACSLWLGCGPEEAASEPEESAAKTMVGELHFAGERLRVEPFVMRTAEMDLFVACRLAKESREQEGQPAGDLCYDATKRASFTQVLIEKIPDSS